MYYVLNADLIKEKYTLINPVPMITPSKKHKIAKQRCERFKCKQLR